MIRIITSTRFVVDDDEEHALRRGALEADLQRLAEGWQPDNDTLSVCPLIDAWSTVLYPGTTELAMQGTVTGHPEFPDDRVVITSPICAMDFRGRWIRT